MSGEKGGFAPLCACGAFTPQDIFDAKMGLA